MKLKKVKLKKSECEDLHEEFKENGYAKKILLDMLAVIGEREQNLWNKVRKKYGFENKDDRYITIQWEKRIIVEEER